MAYYDRSELEAMGFAQLGNNVKISTRAAMYDVNRMILGDNIRIDDFCLVSGKVSIGRNSHVTPYCNLAGGEMGIVLEDFTTLAYGCHVFSQSDDYSGRTMTNSTIPTKFKDEKKEAVRICRYSIIGTGAMIFPGVVVAEGNAVGAGSVVLQSTEPWSIYAGIPARRIKARERGLLELEKQFLAEEHNYIK